MAATKPVVAMVTSRVTFADGTSIVVEQGDQFDPEDRVVVEYPALFGVTVRDATKRPSATRAPRKSKK